MQNIEQDFTIGFYDSSNVFSVYAKQNDTNRVLKFHIADEDQEYSSLLNNNKLSVFIREQLPCGGALPDIPVSTSNIDAANSSVTIPITAQMVEEPGVAVCDVLFMENNGGIYSLLSTTHFKLIIADNPGVPKSGETHQWYENWTELYIRVNQATDSANEAAAAANAAADHAEQVAHDIDESTVKAYADQARDASISATNSEELAHMWANGKADGLSMPSATNNAMYYAGIARGVSGIFNGTVAEWEALPLSEKSNISTVILIDD